jgi:hypothetical protein
MQIDETIEGSAGTSSNAEKPMAHLSEKRANAGIAKQTFLNSAVNKSTVTALVLYALISLVVFNPVFAHIGTVIPGTGGDAFQNIWEIWWSGYALATHSNIYYTYTIFWPVGANIIYQTIAPLTGIISLPFQALGLVTAYNITLLIGMLISAFGMFVLAEYVTKNKYAAFLAGLFYAFSASHVAQAFGHMNWVDIGFIPVLLYFLLRSVYTTRWDSHSILVNGFGIGISFVLLTFLGGFEKAIMSIMLAVLVLVLYILNGLFNKKRQYLFLNKSLWISIVLGIIIAFILGSWGFVPLLHVLTQKNGLGPAQYLNNITDNEQWSNNVLSFFVPSYLNGIFNPNGSESYFRATFGYDPTERIGYMGYVPLLLALAGVYYDIKAHRKRYLLWAAIAIFFGWLSLGPYVQIGKAITSIPTIYLIYHAIHGLNVIREPGRFFIVGTIGLDILAALGFSGMLSKGSIRIFKDKRHNAYALVGIATILFIIGSSGIPHTQGNASVLSTPVPKSAFYKSLGSTKGNFGILMLPTTEYYNTTQPLLYEGLIDYYAALSKKPFVGGYFSRENTTQYVSVYNIPITIQVQNLLDGEGFNYTSPVNENFTNETLFSIYSYDVAAITVAKNAFSPGELLGIEDYLSSLFGSPVYNGNNTIAFATRAAEDAIVNRSYIAYPYLPDWGEYRIAYNGSDYNMFLPTYPGPITVYAPVYNITNSTKHSSIDKTLVSFYAIGEVNGSSLKVEEVATSGYKLVANFTISKDLEQYSFYMNMSAGNPNALLFIPSEEANTSTVLVSGITFSKA